MTLAKLSGIYPSDDTDELTEKLNNINELMDKSRFAAGDLISLAYSHGLPMKEIAIAGRMKHGTCSKYRRQSEFYPAEMRDDLIKDYAVNWSILDVARRYASHVAKQDGKEACVEDATAFLDYCTQDSGESVHTVNHYERQLQIKKGKPKPLEAVVNKVRVEITEVYPDTCELHMVLGEHCEIEPGAYVLTLHKVSEATL